MEGKRVIFVSAVSNEFHKTPPEQRRLFASYRDVLKEAFRLLAPQCEVILRSTGRTDAEIQAEIQQLRTAQPGSPA